MYPKAAGIARFLGKSAPQNGAFPALFTLQRLARAGGNRQSLRDGHKGRLRRPLPWPGCARPCRVCGDTPFPTPLGELFLWRKSSQKARRGKSPATPRRRRTSRYAEHRRHGNAAVAQSRSAPTHANVRLSPNGRAGVFIRARQAEIPPLPRCREVNSSHQWPPPG